jgi:signal transduction histidine kinase/DNA-binding response OmpR family regulator
MSDMSEVHAARLLLVDDEEANLDLLQAILEDDGYRDIRMVRDPREVAAIYPEYQPDLVVLDLHMPYLDGFAVLEQLRAATPADTYVPVLVLTADITTGARERALSGGARDFLTKPLDATETLLRIRNLLETRLLHLQQRAQRAGAEAAERRAVFLAEASRLLSTSFDYQTTLANLARLCVPVIADYCVVDFLDADGKVNRVAAAHVDPLREPLLHEVSHLTVGTTPPEHPEMRALTEGIPVLVPDVTQGMINVAAPSEPHRRIATELAPRSMIAVPLSSSSGVLGALVLVMSESGRRYDATLMRLVEDLARRAALSVENARLYHEAHQATRARDEMLAVVAHDLRNPLNNIYMAASLLLEIMAAERASERRQVEVIQRSAERMNRLVLDLLDLERIEAGRLALDPRPELPFALVHDSVEQLKPLATARSLNLEADAARELPVVLADPVRVQQVISNLVGNAIKFTPEGGTVTVRAERDGDVVCISVIDTGPGIPAQQLPHIFGRFWQADAADRRGLGLGLAIAKGLVEAHGGRIWVESREHMGSTFFFTLPVHEDTRRGRRADDCVPQASGHTVESGTASTIPPPAPRDLPEP